MEQQIFPKVTIVTHVDVNLMEATGAQRMSAIKVITI